jgi:uncharacterized protein (DUF1778 family)
MAVKTDRIESRVSPEARARIEQAAAMAGVSVSSFMVDAAVERAENVIAQHATTIVAADYFDALLATLDDPDPAPRLAKAAAGAKRRGRFASR